VRDDMSSIQTTVKARHSAGLAACLGTLLLLITVACGGGGGSPTSPSPTPTPTPTPTPVSPTVTAITPNTGSTSGATSVTLTGTGFAAGATVTFGGTAATGVTVVNATTITATTPARAAGAVDVVVTNADGRSGVLTGGFTYTAAGAPTISSVSPASGSVNGGNTVTITGTNFIAGATVRFGSALGTSQTFVSSTTVRADTPAAAAPGAVDVTVTLPGGASVTRTGGFTYVAGAPTISSVSPTSGSLSGGTTVTITGTNFFSGATVRFGSAQGTNVTFVSSTTLRADTPAAASPGTVDVVVTLPSGASVTRTSGFTYALSLSGSWSGSTSQGRPLSFTVSGSTITSLMVTYQLSGCPAFVLSDPTSVSISNNSFSRNANITANGTIVGFVTLVGTFTSNVTASGTVTVVENAPSSCPGSLSGTWTATR
jgi:IPT/TIG domain-containing protein